MSFVTILRPAEHRFALREVFDLREPVSYELEERLQHQVDAGFALSSSQMDRTPSGPTKAIRQSARDSLQSAADHWNNSNSPEDTRTAGKSLLGSLAMI